jgi:hypothetical protein
VADSQFEERCVMNLVRIFYYVPLIGWLLKDAVHGSDGARYFFLFNILIVLAGLVYVVGYPLVITLALIGTGLGLSWVILLSMGDVIERVMSRRATKTRGEQPEVVNPIPTRMAA